jgi:uncharacterized protein YhdP
MVGVFDVDDGVARARSLLFDNADTRVSGEGTVDLARERIDLTLKELLEEQEGVKHLL